MGLILNIGGSLFLLIIIVICFYIITNLDKVTKEIKISILRKNYKKIILKIIFSSFNIFICFLLEKGKTSFLTFPNNNSTISMLVDELNRITLLFITSISTFGMVFSIPLTIYYLILLLIKTHLRRKRYRRIKTYIR